MRSFAMQSPPPSLPPLDASALQKCLRMAEHARTHSPRVAQLLRRIDALPGCALRAEPVVCEDAFGVQRVAGAYDHARRLVVMNPRTPAAHLNQGEWTRAVAHELVHAYDSCRARLDPADCRHVACTEVRAANLSGDCDFGTELARGPARLAAAGLAAHQQVCVRRRAQLSLSMHAHCVGGGDAGAGRGTGVGTSRSPGLGVGVGVGRTGAADDDKVARTVASVWDACYADTAPFSSN